MRIPLFDCHCDTISRIATNCESLRSNSFHLDLNRLAKFSPSAQIFAVCTETLAQPKEKSKAMLEKLNREKAMTVIMISHDMDAAMRYANKILHLDKKVLFYGGKDEYLLTAHAKKLLS